MHMVMIRHHHHNALVNFFAIASQNPRWENQTDLERDAARHLEISR